MRRDLTALVVDDEPLARRRLRALLDGVDGVVWAGEAADGEAALAAMTRLGPDVIFLDVEMPGMSGLDVLDRLDDPPQVVFTTAYEDYAVRAFDLRAADYLLKPFGRERLQAAVDRVHELAGGSRGPARQLFARERGRIVPIPVRTIVRMEADGDYVHVHAAGGTHLITATLSELHARLDPERFLRVHRSHVVNLDAVEELEPFSSSRLRMRLRNGDRVVASRARSKELRGRLK